MNELEINYSNYLNKRYLIEKLLFRSQYCKFTVLASNIEEDDEHLKRKIIPFSIHQLYLKLVVFKELK